VHIYWRMPRYCAYLMENAQKIKVFVQTIDELKKDREKPMSYIWMPSFDKVRYKIEKVL